MKAVCELCLVKRGVGSSKVGTRDGRQRPDRNGQDFAWVGFGRVTADGDRKRRKGSIGLYVELGGAIDLQEGRLERGKVDGTDLPIEQLHRRFEATRSNVVGSQRRVSRPECCFADARRDLSSLTIGDESLFDFTPNSSRSRAFSDDLGFVSSDVPCVFDLFGLGLSFARPAIFDCPFV